MVATERQLAGAYFAVYSGQPNCERVFAQNVYEPTARFALRSRKARRREHFQSVYAHLFAAFGAHYDGAGNQYIRGDI